MALDPIVTDWYRAMVLLPHTGGVPSETIIHTWHFRNDSGITNSPADVAATIGVVLDAFYGAVNGTAANAVKDFMPNAYGPPEYLVYDLGQQKPRERHEVVANWLPAGTGSAYLPPELACVLSLRTEYRHKRGRGRIYLGPWMETVTDGGRPMTYLLDAIRESATNVLNTSENVTWGVLSRMDATARAVTGGYVDNSWDVIRGRDPGPTLRSKFGTYVGP